MSRVRRAVRTLSLLAGAGAGWIAAPVSASQEWRAVPELTIGQTPGTELTHVAAVAVRANGDVVVAQSEDGWLQIFDRTGQPKQRLGRRGGGPGEFQSIQGLGWIGDTLWVADWMQHRFTLFVDDVVVNTLRFRGPLQANSMYPTPGVALLADGSVLGDPIVDERTSHSAVPLLRFGRAHTLLDTLLVRDRAARMGTIRLESARINFNRPIADQSHWAVSPKGRYVALAERAGGRMYRIALYDVLGARLFERSFTYQPIEPPSYLLNDARDPMIAFFMKARIPRARAEQLFADSVRLPALQEPVQQLFVDDAGRVYIGREATADRTRRWYVMNAQGVVERSFALDASQTVLWARDQELWVESLSENDEQLLTRFRLER